MSTLQTTRHAILTTLLALLVGGCGGGGDTAPTPIVVTPPTPVTVSKSQRDAASRFASQMTFGMPYSALDDMARAGDEAWLDAQFALPATFHLPTIDNILARRDAGEFDAFENDIEYLIFARRLGWWHNTITAEDTVRQRVAFALSEIFVVSDRVDVLEVYPYALGQYYDNLLKNAFGNFRQLIEDVALSPAMGVYLSHINNRRADPDNNIFPDENFAREVMQLFTIGLFELDPDGSVRTDANGDPIASYDNDDIGEFAKIFTGLSFGGDGAFFGNTDDPRFYVPMVMFEDQHEPGEKRLLNGTVVPPGLTGIEDINLALDNLFEHPNVGPFIGRQLIQRLITSNPSAAYVQRVAATFNDNGSGVRGDMQAVIRAIALDPEARAAPVNSGSFGKLREPVVRYVELLRQFEVTSPDGFIAPLGYFLQDVSQQHPLSSPSVFNFYLPDHSPAGELSELGLVAPEFQITNSNSIIAYPNFIDAIAFGDFVTDTPDGFEPASLSLDAWVTLAADPAALVEQMDTLLMYGSLSAEMSEIYVNAITELNDNELRVRAAMYWFLTSPELAVKH
ncbi:MAG: DUF1800 domain-containing protein [Pseudomonadota bacterium]